MAKDAIKKNVSPFLSSFPAKRTKKVGARALDYFLLIIISVLFFVLTNLVVESLPAIKEKESRLSSIQDEMISLVEESKLGEYENGSYLSNEDIASNYLHRLIYRSLLNAKVSEDDIPSSLSLRYQPIDKESDNLYYYYASFKPAHIDEYLSVEGINGAINYSETLSKDLEISFLIVDDYPLLNEDDAHKAKNYLLDSSYVPGKAIYESLADRYKSLLEEAINEFESSYVPFLSRSSAHTSLKESLYGLRRIEAAISYALGVLVYFLLLPLFLKDGRTIADKAMNIAYCTNKGERPSIINLSIRVVIIFFEFSSILSFIPFIIYGSSAIDLLYLPFLWGISFLSIAIFSFVFMLLSFLSSFIEKERKCFTSEFLSQMLAKDALNFHLEDEKKGVSVDGK